MPTLPLACMLTLLAIVGAAVASLWTIWGVVIAIGAAMFCGFVAANHNKPSVRLAYYVAVAAAGAASYLASKDALLGAALVTVGWPLLPIEPVLRHHRRLHDFQPAIGLLIAGALLTARGRADLWLLTVSPIALIAIVVFVGGLFAGANGRRIIGRAKLRVGDALPDFDLPRRDGNGRLSLQQLRGNNVMLCLVRGDWCPVCHVLTRIIMREADLLKRHGVRVVLITPTAGPLKDDIQRAGGPSTTVLLDENSRFADALGLIETQRRGQLVPLPVAILLDRAGKVSALTRPDDVTAFTTENRIVRALQQLQSQPVEAGR